MTALSAVCIGLFVWAVGLLTSVRARAAAYTLPIPMTVVLLAGDITVSADQLFGLVLLNAFFYTVALLCRFSALNQAFCVLAAAAVYIGLSIAISHAPRVTFWPVALAYVCIWLAVVAYLRVTYFSHSRASGPQLLPTFSFTEQGRRIALIGISCSAALMAAHLMGGLVVTFPFAGILVAWELERTKTYAFACEFQLTSFALFAFFTFMYIAHTTFGLGTYGIISAGWCGFGLALAGLLRVRRTYHST